MSQQILPAADKVVRVRLQVPEYCACGYHSKSSLVAEVFGLCTRCGKKLGGAVVRV